MLWGAGLAWLIFGSAVAHYQSAMRQNGPGIVHYGDGEGSPEWSELVSENQYKREHYAAGLMMSAIGIILWAIVARAARDEKQEAIAEIDYRKAEIRALTAYQHAFASAIDDITREHASNKAELSAEWQKSKASEEVKRANFYTMFKEQNNWVESEYAWR